MCEYFIMLWTNMLRYLSKSPESRENTVKRGCDSLSQPLCIRWVKFYFRLNRGGRV